MGIARVHAGGAHRGRFPRIRCAGNMLFGAPWTVRPAPIPRIGVLARRVRKRMTSRTCTLILWAIRARLSFGQSNSAFPGIGSVSCPLMAVGHLITTRRPWVPRALCGATSGNTHLPLQRSACRMLGRSMSWISGKSAPARWVLSGFGAPARQPYWLRGVSLVLPGMGLRYPTTARGYSFGYPYAGGAA